MYNPVGTKCLSSRPVYDSRGIPPELLMIFISNLSTQKREKIFTHTAILGTNLKSVVDFEKFNNSKVAGAWDLNLQTNLDLVQANYCHVTVTYQVRPLIYHSQYCLF